MTISANVRALVAILSDSSANISPQPKGWDLIYSNHIGGKCAVVYAVSASPVDTTFTLSSGVFV